MLSRVNSNKKLSHLERRFNSEITPSLHFFGLLDDGVLILKYFFDDYLTKRLKTAVEDNGFQYIDINQEITSLPESFEFYTDYCHLTEEGKKKVAEIFGQAILKGM